MHYGTYKRITSKNLMCKKSEIGKMIYTTLQDKVMKVNAAFIILTT